jgi:hypothetical protein
LILPRRIDIVAHMKTTIDIADPLFRAVKKEAQKRGTTFKAVVESSLRQALAASDKGGLRFVLRKHSFKGEGVVEGIVEGDWTRIRGAIYEGRGG